MRLFSKPNSNEYNNQLEKILDYKNFTSETKNLLLNMLYKIENAFPDYKKTKSLNITKEELIQKILKIIKNECETIELIIPRTEESIILQKYNTNCLVDSDTGKIIVYANEQDLLYALFKLDTKINIEKNKKDCRDILQKSKTDEIINDSVEKFIIESNAMNYSEIIRNFNGWAWNTEAKDIKNITYNLIYQNILILLNENIVKSALIKEFEQNNILDSTEKIEDLRDLNPIEVNTLKNSKNKEKNNRRTFSTIIEKALLYKYKDEEIKEFLKSIYTILVAEYINENENLKNIVAQELKEKREFRQLILNKVEFLDNITLMKKKLNKEIEKIDKMLNSKETIEKEYEKRNKKLKNEDKIFSINHLVRILKLERQEKIEQIEMFNKMLEPMEYIKQRQKAIDECELLNNIILLSSQDKIEEKLMYTQQEFLKLLNIKIDEASTNQEIADLFYKIRYYCLLPINSNKSIKDTIIVKKELKKTIDNIIDKGIDKNVIVNISNSISLCYNILKYVFTSKIIDLSKTYITINEDKKKRENNKYYITIDLCNEKEEEEKNSEIVDNIQLLNIKLNKKVPLFL